VTARSGAAAVTGTPPTKRKSVFEGVVQAARGVFFQVSAEIPERRPGDNRIVSFRRLLCGKLVAALGWGTAKHPARSFFDVRDFFFFVFSRETQRWVHFTRAYGTCEKKSPSWSCSTFSSITGKCRGCSGPPGRRRQGISRQGKFEAGGGLEGEDAESAVNTGK